MGWIDEDVRAAHVLVDLHVDLAVGEARDLRVAQRDAAGLGDLLGQRAVRVAREELQLVRHGASLRAHRGGWGGRIRTSEYGVQSPAPCHLATPQSIPFGAIPARLRAGSPRPQHVRDRPARPSDAPRSPGVRICRACSDGPRDPEHRRPAARHQRAQRARRQEAPPSSGRSPGSAAPRPRSSPFVSGRRHRVHVARPQRLDQPRRARRAVGVQPPATRPYTSRVESGKRGFTSTSAQPPPPAAA